jgi:hypothetical protein
MSEKTREVAESAFQKYQRREAEIAVALREEQARHDAAIKNMHRLRSLRLQQEAHTPPPKGKSVPTRSFQTKSLQTKSLQTKSSQKTKSPRTKPSSQTKSRKTA